jgi:hypothetical protein
MNNEQKLLDIQNRLGSLAMYIATKISDPTEKLNHGKYFDQMYGYIMSASQQINRIKNPQIKNPTNLD